MSELTREQEKRILKEAKTVIRKNNFFIKFMYFYIDNIKGLNGDFDNIWYALVDEVLPGLIKTAVSILIIISRFIYLVLPIKQIRNSFISEYIIIKDSDNLRKNIKTGYWHKNAIKEIRQAIAQHDQP